MYTMKQNGRQGPRRSLRGRAPAAGARRAHDLTAEPVGTLFGSDLSAELPLGAAPAAGPRRSPRRSTPFYQVSECDVNSSPR